MCVCVGNCKESNRILQLSHNRKKFVGRNQVYSGKELSFDYQGIYEAGK